MAFGRPDVDTFLSEIDHDAYEEWCAFFAIEPQGWNATNIQTARLSYMLALVNSDQSGQKRLRERDFLLRVGTNDRDPEVEKARWEAHSIRSRIEAGETIDG